MIVIIVRTCCCCVYDYRARITKYLILDSINYGRVPLNAALYLVCVCVCVETRSTNQSEIHNFHFGSILGWNSI